MTQIKIIFSIFGDSIDPIYLNKITKIDDSTFWFKGDAIPKRSILRKESAWEYSTGYINTLFIQDITNSFVSKFHDCAEAIKEYLDKNSLESKVDIVVEIANKQTPSLYLDSSFLKIVNYMAAEIDIDLYVID